jgi:hypothetical protein
MSGDASGDAVMAVPPTGASEIIAACRAARGATYASQSEGAEVDESALKSNCAGQRQVLAKLRPGRGTVLLACPPPACSALGAPRGGKSPAVLGAEVDPHADAVLRELGCEPPQAPPAVLCEGVRACDNPRNRGDPGSEMRLDPLGAFGGAASRAFRGL